MKQVSACKQMIRMEKSGSWGPSQAPPLSCGSPCCCYLWFKSHLMCNVIGCPLLWSVGWMWCSNCHDRKKCYRLFSQDLVREFLFFNLFLLLSCLNPRDNTFSGAFQKQVSKYLGTSGFEKWNFLSTSSNEILPFYFKKQFVIIAYPKN